MKHRIPIKPMSVNRAYTGRRKKSTEYRRYIKTLAYTLPKKVKIYPKMLVVITWGFSNPLSDVDNPAKPFLDILQKQYGFNDRDVWELHLKKTVTKDPFITFEIKEYIEPI